MRLPDHTVSRDHRLLSWAVVGFLLSAVAIVYGQTLWFDFIGYDDELFVTGSPQVRSGLTEKTIVWAFTNGPAGEWYPLSMLSHALDCQLFGATPHGAWGHHLTNVLLHAATTIGLFLVLWRMTDQRAVPKVAQASGARVASAGPSATLWPSALVAILFAIHPQHVESVAWIAERRDVLSGLFFVLTLAAYLGYVRHGRSPARYCLVALCLGLGLMSKAMLVTVPPLLLVLDYWPLGRFGQAAGLPVGAAPVSRQSFSWLVVEKLPLAALAVADAIATVVTHANADKTVTLPWNDRLCQAVMALATYLGQFFYPVDLSVYYPFPVGGYPTWKVVAATGLLLGISAVAFLCRQRWPHLLVGWLWYVGMMIPVLGLVAVSHHAMADRYMYLPGIGIYVALAWSAWEAGAGSVVGRRALAAGAAVLVVVLLCLAVRQTWYWRDAETLWNHSVAVTGPTRQSEIGLAAVASAAGRVDEAIERYGRLQSKDDLQVVNNLGGLLQQAGRLDEAAAEYRRGLALFPDSAAINGNLGAVLAAQGKTTEAEQYLIRAIDLDPSRPAPHLNLARVLARRGQIDAAITQCHRAVEIAPDDPKARQLLDKLNGIRARATSR